MSSSYRKYSFYQPSSRRQEIYPGKKPTSPVPRKLVGIILLILLISGMGLYVDHSNKVAAHKAELAAQAARLEKQHRFAADVRALIDENEKLDISVSTIDLKTGKSQAIGTQEPAIAASTTKLLTACLYLREVELGSRELDDQILWFSGREALWQLINRSNDAVWEEMNLQLGEDKLSAYAKNLGIEDYDVDSNKLSAKSMAVLLQKLYKNELLNRKNTDLLLSYMQKTNYENFIPPAVPKNLKLYHKVGLVDDWVNDAAVISDGKNEFVLAIYTNGNGIYNWEQRAELMQDITSRAIAAYLE